jgi:hypothetical protein
VSGQLAEMKDGRWQMIVAAAGSLCLHVSPRPKAFISWVAGIVAGGGMERTEYPFLYGLLSLCRRYEFLYLLVRAKIFLR